MEIQYYILDLETTGLSCKYHEVHEIGIIRLKDRMQLVREIKCLFPQRANYDALRVTGKTLNDLRRGGSKADIVSECDKFFEEDGADKKSRCIIGHNIWAFDKKFLHALWESCGKEFPADLWMDTMQMTKSVIKKTGTKHKANLESACDYFGIKKASSAHNAKTDTRQTYFLYNKLIEQNMNHLSFIKKDSHNIFHSSINDSDIEDLNAQNDGTDIDYNAEDDD